MVSWHFLLALGEDSLGGDKEGGEGPPGRGEG